MKKSVKKGYKKSFRKGYKKSFRKGYKKSVRNKTKKMQFGGDKFNRLPPIFKADIYSVIFMNISGNSTNEILNKLEQFLTPDILEQMIILSIDKANAPDPKSKTNQVQLPIPYKMPCPYIRELYIELIGNLIDAWIEKCNEIGATNKAKGLGASYIRWVCRSTTRKFTNINEIFTRNACNPKELELRDSNKYSCNIENPNEPCPSIQYVINKYITNTKINPISEDDENNEKWLELVRAARRDNETVTKIADWWKMFIGDYW